jgi:hypothetical protein
VIDGSSETMRRGVGGVAGMTGSAADAADTTDAAHAAGKASSQAVTTKVSQRHVLARLMSDHP